MRPGLQGCGEGSGKRTNSPRFARGRAPRPLPNRELILSHPRRTEISLADAGAHLPTRGSVSGGHACGEGALLSSISRISENTQVPVAQSRAGDEMPQDSKSAPFGNSISRFLLSSTFMAGEGGGGGEEAQQMERSQLTFSLPLVDDQI